MFVVNSKPSVVSLAASAFEECLGGKKSMQEKPLSSAPQLWLPPSCPLLLQGIALATCEGTSGALQDLDIRVNTNLGGGG